MANCDSFLSQFDLFSSGSMRPVRGDASALFNIRGRPSKDQCVEVGGSLILGVLGDIRVAARQHARRPGFAIAIIGTLGLTIGATTAVFSVVNGVLLRSLAGASPDRLVWVASVRSDNPNAPFSLPEFMDYRDQTRTLAGLGAYSYWIASLAGDSVTERLEGARISGNLFDVLGLSPAAGRLLNDGDDRPDAPRVVVISYRLWQRRYGGAANIVGAPIRINAEPAILVGVLPPHFLLPRMPNVDIVTALVPDRDPLRHRRASTNFLRLIGRLGPGTAAEAQAELTAIAKSLRQQFPVEYVRKEAVRVEVLQEVLVGDYRRSMFILFTAVIVVLATALANLMSLTLVRMSGRIAELTVRTALGASRRQLARQLATEAVLLAVCGSAVGVLIAQQAVRLAIRWAPASIPRLSEVSLDATVTLFVVAVTAVVSILLTLAPLRAVARTRAGDVLRLASRGAIGDRWNVRVRNIIVVAEIAIAAVLLVATTVLLRDLRDLERVEPGFTPDGVFQARVSIPPTYRTPDEVSRFYERLSERLGSSPGVEHVGVISVAPLSGLLRTIPFSVQGQSTAERDRVMANLRTISPGYLEAVGTRLVGGRPIADTDRSDTPRVALVSAALADRFLSKRWTGQQLLIPDNTGGQRPLEIVGVVDNVRHAALDRPGELDIYLPLRQINADEVSSVRETQFWIVRTAANPAAFRGTFLEHLRAVDPDAAVSNPGAMRQLVDDSLGPRRFNLTLFGAFAATAVMLAVVGLYSLVSYAVSQRAQEIGLRMAIGASQADVQRMILRQAATLGLLGIAVGVGLTAAGAPLVSSMVPELVIPIAMAASATTLLFIVVLVAAWWPARRAAKTEPTVALRTS